MTTNIDTILKEFERFGVDLGLDRINRLLADLGNPQELVPIIHVAGTNGKGSVCAYLSAILTQAGYRVGRYTSPHLVDWTERICLNEEPIAPEELQTILREIKDAISPSLPSPTQFEVITAAAWLYFAQKQVDIAVMEVGLGGRLDATNVCSQPLVTIITSISWEHWQRLGPTLAHIAAEKAGILKPQRPAIIGQLPPEAMAVVKQRITDLDCPAWFPPPAIDLGTKAKYREIEYPLPLPGKAQLGNSTLAIEAIRVLQQQGWQIADADIVAGMGKTKWPGRLQWVTLYNQTILVDGAHNGAAAEVLRQYVDTLSPKATTWVMGMLSTKDHEGIFRALLRPGDSLYLVPVPDHSTAAPEELGALAAKICPGLAAIRCCSDLQTALEKALLGEAPIDKLTVLCGSLYLLGHFFANHSKI